MQILYDHNSFLSRNWECSCSVQILSFWWSGIAPPSGQECARKSGSHQVALSVLANFILGVLQKHKTRPRQVATPELTELVIRSRVAMVMAGGILGCLWLCRSQCLWAIRLLPLMIMAGVARSWKSFQIVHLAMVAVLSMFFLDSGVSRVTECTCFNMFIFYCIGLLAFFHMWFSSSLFFFP